MRSGCRLLAIYSILAFALTAQPPQGSGASMSEGMRQGIQLDLDGKGTEARTAFQREIDTAPTPAARANAQRAMAMSWAFEGNCKKTAEYEDLVIAYWRTQESTAPERAFYQQGEMANEAARVCIDNGDLRAAEELYKRGRDLGLKEPGISPARKDLWEYRWEHAQARLAARRGDKAEADAHVAKANSILEDLKDKDPKLYDQQKSFLPYLTGYVALYTGDLKTAISELQAANQSDAFIQCLIGMAYEKIGDKDKAANAYRRAADVRGHNPPAAFAKPFTRKKLANT
jgi:hypothetical protein